VARASVAATVTVGTSSLVRVTVALLGVRGRRRCRRPEIEDDGFVRLDRGVLEGVSVSVTVFTPAGKITLPPGPPPVVSCA